MSVPEQDLHQRIALLERRLNRSQRALNEAESALESRMRELAIANDSLRQSEEELAEKLQIESKQLIAAQKVGGFATIVGRPGQPYQASPELNSILGFPTGMRLSVDHLVSRFHKLDRARVLNDAWRFFNELAPDKDHEFLHRIEHPQRGVRWLQWYIRRTSGKDGEPKSVLGSVRDVTEIRHNERQVKALQLRAERRVRELDRMTTRLEAEQERAEAALQVRTRFLSTMAHQFRTPLATITGLVEAFAEENLDEKTKNQLMLAERSAERISALLDEALAEADGSSQSVSLFTAPLVLEDFFRSSRDFWQASLGSDGAGKLTFQIETPMPARVDADAVRLRELFDDLVGSGIEACGAVTIDASWDGKLHFSMHPSSKSCPANAPALMEKDPQMRRVVELAGAMGGTAEFDSIKGCLLVKLSLKPVASELPINQQPLVTSNGERPYVLLAEDTESNRAIIAAMLEKMGCRVETAVNGAEALEAATSQRFDAVLMDVMMPVMDGEEAVRRIRAAPEPFSRTPVIGITAHTLHEERERLLAAGMSACLPKPVKKMELRSSLITALGPTGGKVPGKNFDLEQFTAAFEAVPPHYRLRFLEAVETDLRNYGDGLVNSIEAGDHIAADRNAHALKGVAGNLGATMLLETIAYVRTLLANREPVEAKDFATLLEQTEMECRDLFEARYGGL